MIGIDSVEVGALDLLSIKVAVATATAGELDAVLLWWYPSGGSGWVGLIFSACWWLADWLVLGGA